jgi:hypothetical protein
VSPPRSRLPLLKLHTSTTFRFSSTLAQTMSVDPSEISTIDLNTAMMPFISTAAKRLTEPDVQTVFSCLWSNQQPPKRLKFRIIRVPQNGLKLSPPSFEFDGEIHLPLFTFRIFLADVILAFPQPILDGLYVLLRSPMNELAPVPTEHANALMTDSELASLPSCPWSLSGPQYPKHDGQTIQQRYCYPRGNPGYSNGKGGAMWTMVSLDLRLGFCFCCVCYSNREFCSYRSTRGVRTLTVGFYMCTTRANEQGSFPTPSQSNPQALKASESTRAAARRRDWPAKLPQRRL